MKNNKEFTAVEMSTAIQHQCLPLCRLLPYKTEVGQRKKETRN